MNQGAADAMGIKSPASDVGMTFDFMFSTDASATPVIANRRGVGKTRHKDTQASRVQKAMRNRELEVAEGQRRGERRWTYSHRTVLEKLVAEIGFIKTTRRGTGDEFTGAHEQIIIQPVSAAQKSVV